MTAFDLGMESTVVNNIVRYHYNKAFELYNTLDYWTIYIENVGTLWATPERIAKYQKKVTEIRDILAENGEIRYYVPEDIPRFNEILVKLEKLKEMALKDRMDKKAFNNARKQRLANV
jgi:hypothetical protein